MFSPLKHVIKICLNRNRHHLFAGNFFEELIEEIDRLAESIPEVKPFIPKIDADIRKGEAAAKSGDKNAILESLAEGIKDAQAIEEAVKSNPKVHKLDKRAPAIIDRLSGQIKKGTKAPKDVNEMAGYFDKKLEQAS